MHASRARPRTYGVHGQKLLSCGGVALRCFAGSSCGLRRDGSWVRGHHAKSFARAIAHNCACIRVRTGFGLVPLNHASTGATHRRATKLARPSTVANASRNFHSFSSHRQDLSALQGLKARTAHDSSLVFVSTSNDPYFNLSVEHYLLTNSDHGSRILFLFINRPCVVFGRNQNPWVECNLPAIAAGLPTIPGQSCDGSDSESARTPIDMLRRRSGGGTVFHDQGNLNYCAIVPNDKSFSRNTHAEMVVRALQKLQAGSAGTPEIKVNERHDIVMRRQGEQQWLKISGSAYKLTRGRALHHGTLLFQSPYLTRISGLLNGLGKDLITMKGVGSVRSPVGNLFGTEIQSDGSRSELSRRLQSFIMDEWHRLYDTPAPEAPTEIDFDDGLKDSSQVLSKPVSGRDNPAATIAAGMAELHSLDWKYGQTPRCTFQSRLKDDEKSLNLIMEVNRGVIEKAAFEVDGQQESLNLDASLGMPLKVWEVKSWKTWLEGLQSAAGRKTSGPGQDQSETLQKVISVVSKDKKIVERLEECFPYHES